MSASVAVGCKRWNGLLLPCGIIVPAVNGLSGPRQGGVHVEHTTIAVDLAKSVFQVAVSHRPGHLDEARRLPRERFLAFFAQRPPATIVLEACGSAHYWARQLQPLGHAVRLLPAHDVRPYVRRNKTDRTDAKGLLEANRNEEIHPVPVKTIEHQAIASLHRLRSTWLATRTARLNTLRGLLREFGIFIPTGSQRVVPRVRALHEDPAVPPLLHATLAAACDEIERLEGNMRVVEQQLAALADDMPDVQLLQTVPGVGLITATALVALVTDIRRFPSGRHFASFLGLTPREDSSALRRRLGAISKQGDVYVRMLLTHGARSLVWHAKAAGRPTPLQQWAMQTELRRGRNVAAVAVANKLARIVWAVWVQQRPFAADHRLG
jgi:transposase